MRGIDELRQLPAGGRIDRHVAPTGHAQADLRQFACRMLRQSSAARVVVVRQEHVAGGDAAGVQGDAGLVRQRAQEALRAVDQHAAAVAGQSVGGDAAAMRHPRQRFQRNVDDGTRSGPSTCAMRPKPQLSCSLAGSYRPRSGLCRIVVIVIGRGADRSRGGHRETYRFIRIEHILCDATTQFPQKISLPQKLLT
jgi:hypothetical protein